MNTCLYLLLTCVTLISALPAARKHRSACNPTPLPIKEKLLYEAFDKTMSELDKCEDHSDHHTNHDPTNCVSEPDATNHKAIQRGICTAHVVLLRNESIFPAAIEYVKCECESCYGTLIKDGAVISASCQAFQRPRRVLVRSSTCSDQGYYEWKACKLPVPVACQCRLPRR